MAISFSRRVLLYADCYFHMSGIWQLNPKIPKSDSVVAFTDLTDLTCKIFKTFIWFLCLVRTGRECCVDSPSPDNDLFKHLARVYASANPIMRTGNACPPEYFGRGITNGAHWYEVKGMWLYTVYIWALNVW